MHLQYIHVHVHMYLKMRRSPVHACSFDECLTELLSKIFLQCTDSDGLTFFNMPDTFFSLCSILAVDIIKWHAFNRVTIIIFI